MRLIQMYAVCSICMGLVEHGSPEEPATAHHALGSDWLEDFDGMTAREARALFERALVVRVMAQEENNIAAVAQRLGMSRFNAHKIAKKFGLGRRRQSASRVVRSDARPLVTANKSV